MTVWYCFLTNNHYIFRSAILAPLAVLISDWITGTQLDVASQRHTMAQIAAAIWLMCAREHSAGRNAVLWREENRRTRRKTLGVGARQKTQLTVHAGNRTRARGERHAGKAHALPTGPTHRLNGKWPQAAHSNFKSMKIWNLGPVLLGEGNRSRYWF